MLNLKTKDRISTLFFKRDLILTVTSCSETESSIREILITIMIITTCSIYIRLVTIAILYRPIVNLKEKRYN